MNNTHHHFLVPLLSIFIAYQASALQPLRNVDSVESLRNSPTYVVVTRPIELRMTRNGLPFDLFESSAAGDWGCDAVSDRPSNRTMTPGQYEVLSNTIGYYGPRADHYVSISGVLFGIRKGSDLFTFACTSSVDPEIPEQNSLLPGLFGYRAFLTLGAIRRLFDWKFYFAR